jgi:peptide deformylase
MPTRDIVIAPQPVLKTPAETVAAVDDGVRTLLDDMLATMYAAPGIGLAAPQVGVGLRLCVVDVSEKDRPARPMYFVNPTILEASSERVIAEEGCLSLPEIYADVERPAAVRVGFLDRDGEPRQIEAEGLLARCLQHEIDHLDGVLFVDHLSLLRRKMLLRKLAKLQRNKQRGD